jgi:CHRD domain/PEP-CTERM motif
MRKSLLVAAACVGLLSAPSRVHADPLLFSAVLTGAAEAEPTGSPGLGIALVAYDPTQHMMGVLAGFQGLMSPTAAAHIHCCVDPPGEAGVATPVPTFPGFPSGVTSGFYSQFFNLNDASSYNPAFLVANGNSPAAAELSLTQGLASGRAYFNIHTALFPGGEIRGFFTAVNGPSAIPEPTSFALLGSGLLGAVFVRRWRQRKR